MGKCDEDRSQTDDVVIKDEEWTAPPSQFDHDMLQSMIEAEPEHKKRERLKLATKVVEEGRKCQQEIQSCSQIMKLRPITLNNAVGQHDRVEGTRSRLSNCSMPSNATTSRSKVVHGNTGRKSGRSERSCRGGKRRAADKFSKMNGLRTVARPEDPGSRRSNSSQSKATCKR